MVNNEKGVIDMVDLADLGVVCECGSRRLAPAGELEPGSLVVCASCGHPYRFAVALVPVRWSEVESELEGRPHELYAMRWHRQGVVPHARRSLAELRRSGGRFTASDRAGVVLGATLVLLLVLVILKAVHS